MEEGAAGSNGEPDRGPKWVGRTGEMSIIVPSDPEVFTRRMTVLVTSLPTMGQPLRGVASVAVCHGDSRGVASCGPLP